MFSDNRKISERQIFRLLTYDLLGLGTLLVPTVLANTASRDGIFGILIGVVAGLLYLVLLKWILEDMTGSFEEYLRQKVGNFLSKIILVGYLIYFVLLSGYTAYLFTEIVLKNLLREESFWLVLGLLLILVGYGIWEGIEGRARVYELLFWVLMVPLFLMLLSSLNEIQIDYWTPIFSAEAGAVLTGGYYAFFPFSLVFLLLFLGQYVEKKETLAKAGKKALVFAGIIYGVLYLILIGIFGGAALRKMEFPAITLMSTIKTSGSFFKRTDALMFGIWFFTLYALLSSLVFYGAATLRSLTGMRKERGSAILILAVTFAVAVLFYQSDAVCRDYEGFLWYVGTPFLVAIPLILFLCSIGKKQKRQMCVLAVFLLSSSFLCGCNTAELEDRNFPVELAVEDTDSFAREWLNADQSGNRVVDYNHLKVLILARSFVEDATNMQEFLELLEKKTDVPRNTYVVIAEEPEKIMELKGNQDESVGTYLEQLFENVSEIKKRMYPTLGMLYQEKENHLETLFIPVVGEVEKAPKVTEYYVWKRGEAAGMMDSEKAMLSFFSQNALDSYTITLEDGIVKLSAMHNELEFTEQKINVRVRCEAEIVYQPKEKRKGEEGKIKKGEAQNRLEQQFQQYLNKLAEDGLKQGVDVTNSYRKLGGLNREWFFFYQENHQTYEQHISIEYEPKLTWINL